MADVKLSERTHPLYDDNIDNWDLYKDAAKGGESFITDENLFSHRLEDSTDYSDRLDRAFFLNLCDLLPTIYNNYIFRTSVERAPNPDLAPFRLNADGRGTPISELVRRAGYFASTFGVIHYLVDMPISPKRKMSKADVRNGNINPYGSIIYPHQLRDWSLDKEGRFRWVIIESVFYRDLDPTVEREEELHYKLITTENWEIQNEDGESVKFDDGTPSKGDNPLGVVPIATMYHTANYGDDKIGESLIKDVVFINREIMNFCSLISESIARQAFSQLVVPDDGSLAEAAEDGTANPLVKLGTSSVWTYSSESRTMPAYISPDAEIIATVWRLTTDLVKECFRLASLVGGTSDLYTQSSGRQSQMSFMGVNAALSDKAMSYQKFENSLSKLALMQLGKDVESFEEVKYPTSFDIAALEEELLNYMNIMEHNFSPVLNKTIQKNIVRRVIPTSPQSVRTEIENEIDSGDGIVEPVAANTDNLTDERGNPNTDLGKTTKTSEQKTKEGTSHRKEK